MYGSAFLAYLVDRFGMDALSAFVQDYGRRLVPFAMNHLARRHFGSDFMTLYDAFALGTIQEAQRVERAVQQRGHSQPEALTHIGEFNGYPVFTADGTGVLFVRSDGNQPRHVARLDLQSGAVSRIGPCHGGCDRLARNRTGLYTVHQTPHRLLSTHGEVYRRSPDGT